MRNKLEEATKLALEGKLQETSEITTLEDVFMCLGAKKPFKDDGIISDEGINAEKKLYVLLNGLNNLGIIDFDEDRCDRVIDEIISE